MLNIFYPASCVFCDMLTQRDLDLCIACERELPVLHNSCCRCAEPLPNGQKICGACLRRTIPQINTIALFHYASPINRLITQLKFMSNLANAELLGQLLSRYLTIYYQNNAKPEVIIPMPLHSQRLRERGYNQALELARPSSKKLQISLDKFSVQRVKNTLPQATLTAKERRKNMRRAFVVTRKLYYQHVAVIDDVVTTGSTMAALCKVLYRAGIGKIDIWCCARSSHRGGDSL